MNVCVCVCVSVFVSNLLILIFPVHVFGFLMTGCIHGQCLKGLDFFILLFKNTPLIYSAYAPGITGLGKHILYTHTMHTCTHTHVHPVIRVNLVLRQN